MEQETAGQATVGATAGAVAVVARLLCIVGHHRYVQAAWLSPPQSRGVNCIGDDWFYGTVCERCGKWKTFAAGRQHIHYRVGVFALQTGDPCGSPPKNGKDASPAPLAPEREEAW
jgi:hypothetical protein